MAKLKDFTPDKRNANKGTAKGQKMIVRSIQEDGFGRSALLDKNNQIIAGNKTSEADTADKVTNAAGKMIDQYQERVAHLELIAKEHLQMIEDQEIEMQSMRVEMGRLQRLVAEYQQGIAILTDQVESLGHSPRYRPADNARVI